MWDRIINNATRNVEALKDPEAVKQLGNILKTNVRACQAIGHPFVTQLGRIYLDMLNVYQVSTRSLKSEDTSVSTTEGAKEWDIYKLRRGTMQIDLNNHFPGP